MTLATLQNDVASFLGQSISTSTRITTTEQNKWINDAYHMMEVDLFSVDNSFWTIDTEENDTEAGTDAYDLESDFLGMKRLEIQYDDDTDKVLATPITMNQITGTLSPEEETWSQSNPYYYIIDGQYVIKPTPDEDSADWTTDAGSAVKYWYYQQGADLSESTDTPVIPASYHYVIPYYAAMNGHLKLGNDDRAREFERKWITGRREMIDSFTKIDKSLSMGFTIRRGRNKQSGIYRP